MGWPEITWIVLAAMGVAVNLAKHGEARTQPFSFWIALTNVAIMTFLLYMGGFFS